MINYNVVFHVDTADNALNVALRNVLNYSEALPDERYKMALVANSKAVTLLRKEHGEFAEALEKVHAKGLSIRVCNNALNELGVHPDELYDLCAVVPAGIVEIVRLQSEGTAYIKP